MVSLIDYPHKGRNSQSIRTEDFTICNCVLTRRPLFLAVAFITLWNVIFTYNTSLLFYFLYFIPHFAKKLWKWKYLFPQFIQHPRFQSKQIVDIFTMRISMNRLKKNTSTSNLLLLIYCLPKNYQYSHCSMWWHPSTRTLSLVSSQREHLFAYVTMYGFIVAGSSPCLFLLLSQLLVGISKRRVAGVPASRLENGYWLGKHC